MGSRQHKEALYDRENVEGEETSEGAKGVLLKMLR
jgi:hypothetical protein